MADHLITMNTFKSKLLFLLFFGLTSSSFASFLEVLESARAEAEAQQLFFQGLSEEYRIETISLVGKANSINDTNWKRILEGGSKIVSAEHYRYALDSHYIWLAFKKTIDFIITEYNKLQGSEENKYQSSAIQWAIWFLLEQSGRAGAIAYADMLPGLDSLIINGHHIKNKNAYEAVKILLGQTVIDCRLDPESQAHMNLDLGLVSSVLYNEFADLKIYKADFLDYKAMHSFYNLLKPYYLNSHPISGQFPVSLGSLADKWTDIVSLDTLPRVLRDYQKLCKKLGTEQKLDEKFQIQKLLSPFELEFKEKLIRDKKTKENQKKKAKAKRQKDRKAQALALELAAASVQEELQNEPEIEEPEQKTARPNYFVEENKRAVLEDHGLEYMSYTDWVNKERQLSLAKKTAAKPDNKPLSLERNMTSLSGGALKIYKTAMGLGSSQTTNQDLKEFLNQVGGSFVKCSGPHSDIKIALPNYNIEATNEILVDKMHLMHSGSEEFPVKRLQIHLRRMIERSGLPLVINKEN